MKNSICKCIKYHQIKSKSFTLAEVLIVLGIIGVIAAICLPTLIKKYQQHETVTGIKKVYSELFQAIKLSQIDNGDVSTWDFDQYQPAFDEQYIFKYMKVIDKTTLSAAKSKYKVTYLQSSGKPETLLGIMYSSNIYTMSDGTQFFAATDINMSSGIFDKS